MNTQNPPTTPDIPKLAERAFEYYNSQDDVDALWAYLADTDDETLADAIAFDIRDLLHNGNVDELFDTEHLTEDEVEQLAMRFHNGYETGQLMELSNFIATLIMTHYPII